MDWDDLRMVLAVGRCGTLSGATVSLRVAHTTVGRRLDRIERDLGVRLFDRTPDGFAPTDAGVEIIALAERTEAAVLEAETRVRGRDAAPDGPLRVTTLDFLLEAHAEVFASFCEAHPDIELTVSVTEEEVSLFRREADVALRMTNRPPTTLVGRKVGRVEFAVYGHRDLVGSTQDWSALPWLHWDEKLEHLSRWLDGFLAEHAPGARIALRLGESTLARRSALLAGIGVHPLSTLEGDRFPELVRVGPVLDAFSRDLWLLTLPALRRTRRVRAFVDHVGRALRGSAGTSPG
ncbi:MAG: LysR family transcriptional regulator [Alphaproteobacteria bacterium]|nr:LysR family transcriptional regulator [Alphaproteobacteria bacterium]